jgi:hypothetical protein
VLVVQSLFALCLISTLQLLVPRDIPFAVTGSSKVVNAVTSKVSLETISYANESAALDAIDLSKVYGAYIPGTKSDTLIVVPAKSFFGRVELEGAFADAAKKLGRHVDVRTVKLMMVPLPIGGYVSATMLKTATGTATGRWRGLVLAGFAIVAGMVVNLIVGPRLKGYPTAKAPGSRRNTPADPNLPAFWRDIGPFLPPRNAYILLRNTIYFDGHGITQALIVLLLYLVIAGAALGFLGWFRTPELPVAPETEAEAAAVTVPIGAAP